MPTRWPLTSRRCAACSKADYCFEEWSDPRVSHATAAAAAAATTAEPTVDVASPTSTNTTVPTANATSLYTGHGTPAMYTWERLGEGAVTL